MVNAPAGGGQAGAARCCHRAKCFSLAVGLYSGLCQQSAASRNFEPISPTVIICNTFWFGYRVFGKDLKYTPVRYCKPQCDNGKSNPCLNPHFFSQKQNTQSDRERWNK